MVLGMWIESLFEWARFFGYGWYSSVREVVIQVLTIVVVFTVLVWTAIFMYGAFYYSYMPSAAHTKDIHLQFRSDCEIKNDKHVSKLCSFPSANFSLTRDGSKPILKIGQPYVMSLYLDMPESPVNHHQGMFMVEINVYTKHGAMVKRSRRSSIIHYKSDLLKTLETCVFLGSYLFGRIHQKQLIQVDLFEEFEEDPYKPTVGAVVEVQSQYIEIYSSRLIIHAKFSGLRYLMFYYPIISASVGVIINMFFLLVLTLLSWHKFGPAPMPGDKTSPTTATHVTWDDRKRQTKNRPGQRTAGRKALASESPEKTSLTSKQDDASAISMASESLSAGISKAPESLSAAEAGDDEAVIAGEDTFEVLEGKAKEGTVGVRKRWTADSK